MHPKQLRKDLYNSSGIPKIKNQTIIPLSLPNVVTKLYGIFKNTSP